MYPTRCAMKCTCKSDDNLMLSKQSVNKIHSNFGKEFGPGLCKPSNRVERRCPEQEEPGQ